MEQRGAIDCGQTQRYWEPIPVRSARDREGTMFPDSIPCVGDKELSLRRRANWATTLDSQSSAAKFPEVRSNQALKTPPNQSGDPISNALRVWEPVKHIPHEFKPEWLQRIDRTNWIGHQFKKLRSSLRKCPEAQHCSGARHIKSHNVIWPSSISTLPRRFYFRKF